MSFDDKANRLIELMPVNVTNKKTASEAINAIETSGKTNTHDGLLEGLRMSYKGRKRVCVMLFTGGHLSAGPITTPNDIARSIVKETNLLRQLSSTSRVNLHIFGIFGEGNFLRNLAESVGDGNYYNVDNDNHANTFSYVVSNAINQVAEDLTISMSPSSDHVKFKQAMTKFKQIEESSKDLVVKIPALSDQQSRHIVLELTVFPTQEEINYEELFSVSARYRNSITNVMQSCDEYLYVGRARHWAETNFEVTEQHNRVKVAGKLDRALQYLENDNRQDTLAELRDAKELIEESEAKDRSLSMCIRNEIEQLITVVEKNLGIAKIPLQESLKSHWYEQGGLASCYKTQKENTMIKVVTRNTTLLDV